MLESFLIFFEKQVFGMDWLNTLVMSFLNIIGINVSTKFGGSIAFFIYDTIKIILLLLISITIITYIQTYLSNEKIKGVISKFGGIKGNIIAALLGTITPFCSCSSIPIFIGFTKAKLPLGVIFSFLISSPMVDISSIIILSGSFGVTISMLYVIAGLFVAVVGGTLIGKFSCKNQINYFDMKDSNEVFNINLTKKDRLNISFKQALKLVKEMILYIFIGVGIGAFIHNYIPSDIIVGVLGSENPFGVILSTLIGMPIYADMFTTIPIAEALLLKGAQLGSILSFMMAITVYSIPSIIMLKKIIKTKLLLVFIAICTLGIIFTGYLFNFLHPFLLN